MLISVLGSKKTISPLFLQLIRSEIQDGRDTHDIARSHMTVTNESILMILVSISEVFKMVGRPYPVILAKVMVVRQPKLIFWPNLVLADTVFFFIDYTSSGPL